MDFRRVVSALTSHAKVQARISSQQRQGRNQKGKGNESLYLESGLSPSATPNEEGYGHDWESDDRSSSKWLDDSWISATGRYCTKSFDSCQPSNTPGFGPWLHTRSIGSRAAIERFKKRSSNNTRATCPSCFPFLR